VCGVCPGPRLHLFLAAREFARTSDACKIEEQKARTVTLIHPTAIVHPKAELDPTVEVGPYTIIEGQVRIGARTRILSHAFLTGRTVIGEDNFIGVFAAIGTPPQHLAYKDGDTGLVIGNRNQIREHTSIHRAFEPGNDTVIGDDNFLMTNSHVAHDCRLGDQVVLVNNVLLGGHSRVDDRAVLGGGVAVHQFTRIGTLVMVGGLAAVTKDVPPFLMVGHEGTVGGINTVGLRRAALDSATRTKIKLAFRILYHSGLNVQQAVAEMEKQMGNDPEIAKMIEFIRSSTRGIVRCSHAGSRGE
jgi:UDP-N-acetylglucosamine acyltransferase